MGEEGESVCGERDRETESREQREEKLFLRVPRSACSCGGRVAGRLARRRIHDREDGTLL